MSRTTDQCLLQLNGATQQQVYKFKYLVVAFANDERHNEELDIQICKAIAIKRALHYSIAVRRELPKTSKALNFRDNLCPFSPTVSVYGSENSVMTKRVQPQVLASKMRLLKKIKGVILLTTCGSLEILKSLQPLLLQIERSQRRWFDHVSKMPQEKLPSKLYLPKQMGKRKSWAT